MCMCETKFEIILLGAFCMLCNVSAVYGLIMLDDQGLNEIIRYTTIVYHGVSAVLALILILGALSGSKGLLDKWDLGTKLRILFGVALGAAMFFVEKPTEGRDSKKKIAILPGLQRLIFLGASGHKAAEFDRKDFALGYIAYIILIVLADYYSTQEFERRITSFEK